MSADTSSYTICSAPNVYMFVYILIETRIAPLIDIWRLKSPTVKRFTFRQRQPLIRSLLDYFLISTCINDMVDKTKILTSFCSDHSCIEL